MKRGIYFVAAHLHLERPGYVIVCVLVAAAVGTFDILAAWSAAGLLSGRFNAHGAPDLLHCAVVVGALLGRSAGGFVVAILTAKCIQAIYYSVQMRILNDALLCANRREMSENKSVLHVQLITHDAPHYIQLFVVPLMQLIVEILLVLPIMVYLCVKSSLPSLLLVFGSACCMYATHRLLRPLTIKTSTRIQMFSKNMVQFITENLKAQAEYAAVNRLDRLKERAGNVFAQYSREVGVITGINLIHRPIIEAVLLTGIVVYAISMLLLQPRTSIMTPIEISSLGILLFRIGPASARILAAFANIKMSYESRIKLQRLAAPSVLNHARPLGTVTDYSWSEVIDVRPEYRFVGVNGDVARRICIKPGLVLLAGASGIGKTTLLEELILPSRTTTVASRAPVLDVTKRRICYVPQFPVPFSGRVSDYFFEFGVSDDVAIRTAIKVVGLEGRIKDPGIVLHGEASLSGGESYRLALARAFCLKPEILLLDEPLASLDVGAKRSIATEISGFAKESCVIVVSHEWPVEAADVRRYKLQRE